jgi:hypothetical protein
MESKILTYFQFLSPIEAHSILGWRTLPALSFHLTLSWYALSRYFGPSYLFSLQKLKDKEKKDQME